MDYYGYFPTFNFLVVETQIIVTFIGFAAVFFIFWYNSKYRIATSYGKEKLTKEDTFELVIATIIFLVIIFIGIIVVINNASILTTVPLLVEEAVAENPSVPLPDFINDRLNSLDFAHKIFLLWMFASFIYLAVLTLRLDIFDMFVEEKDATKTEQKEKKTKRVKNNVKKNKKLSGGK